MRRCFLLAAFAFGMANAAIGQTLRMTPQLRIRPGETGYVYIRADADLKGVTGVQLLLDYSAKTPENAPSVTPAIENPKNPTEIVVGGLLPSPFYALVIQEERISYVEVLFSPYKTGDGPGLIVAFPFLMPIDAPAGARYALILLKHQAIDLASATIPTTVNQGILIADPNAPPPGDVNGDGAANVSDAILLLKIIAGLVTPTDQQINAGDVSPRDGRLNVADVIGVLKLSVGLPIRSN